MPATIPQLLDQIRALQIIDRKGIEQIESKVKPLVQSASDFVRELVHQGIVTPYQANKIAGGKAKDLLVGQRYLLLERLGKGGMGEVYKARHAQLDRIVALKLIQKSYLSNSVAVKRFDREAKAAAKLSHPNVIAVHDVGQSDGVHYLAMEFVEGIDLAKLVHQSGRLPIPQACEFIRQAALGLAHAHENGLVHRDIKPGNLLVTQSEPDKPPTIKVLDFGLARFADNTARTKLTKVGKLVGTVDYVSPEQAVDASKADVRSDIYSLGCTLFFLLTGKAPFGGETRVERLSARLLGSLEPVRKTRPEVPVDLEQIIVMMAAPDPSHRFQTAKDAAKALAPFAKVETTHATFVKSQPERPRTAPPPKSPSTMSGVSIRASSQPSRSIAGAAPKRGYTGWFVAAGVAFVSLMALAAVLLMKSGDGVAKPNPQAGKTDPKPLVPPGTDKDKDEAPIVKLKPMPTPPPATNKDKGEPPMVKTKVQPNKPPTKDKDKDKGMAKTPAGNTSPNNPQPPTNNKDKDGNNVEPAAQPNVNPKPKHVEEELKPNVVTLRGHTNGVFSVSYSPDGRRIVSGGNDYTLKVWDAETGQEVRTLRGHTDTVRSVSYSPDGKRIVSCSYANTPKVWDAETGQEVRTLRGPRVWMTRAAYSPDGKRIVSGRGGGGGRATSACLWVWDAETGQEVRTLRGHTSAVHSMGYSPNGKRIVSGGRDNTLKVWDAETGQEVLTLRGHTSEVWSVSYSPDGKRIVSGSYDKTLKVWDAETGQEVRTLRGHTDTVRSVSYSPDGKHIVSGSYDKTLTVWDAETGQEVRTLRGHTGKVMSVSYSPDGKRIVSGSLDNTVKVWEVGSHVSKPKPPPPGGKGLKIEILIQGTGDIIKEGDVAGFLYRTTLTDGKELDSNHDRKSPFIFQVGRETAIKGWHLGIVGMKVGEKRRLTVPPELAYGSKGFATIPPNATVIFEIELLRIYRRPAASDKSPAPDNDTTPKKPVLPAVTRKLDKYVTNSIGMKQVYIPPGKFMMGSSEKQIEQFKKDPASEDSNLGAWHIRERPLHRVTITYPIYMGVHEVTQEQYEKIMGANPSLRKNSPKHPVTRVLYDEAVEFCKKLSDHPDEKKAGRVYRLPTEAEWEYACRAGTTTVFHWGDSLSSKQANFDGAKPFGKAEVGRNYRTTTPVGWYEYKPNAWGLYDMHGNVWEWCLDRPRRYTSKSVENPMGDFGSGDIRIIRGGSYLDAAVNCRSALRNQYDPSQRGGNVGFRVVSTDGRDEPVVPEPTSKTNGLKNEMLKKKESTAPAAKKAKRDGQVISTKSGLKYADLKIGTGKQAKAGHTVTVHYIVTLKNGKKFDSSKDSGRPFRFQLGKPRGPNAGMFGAGALIQCWDEAVAGMKEGGQRKLSIPPSRGLPGNTKITIGSNVIVNNVVVQRAVTVTANTQLLLDVQLLKVE